MDDRVSLGSSTLFCLIFSTIFSTSVGGGGGGGGIAGTIASLTNHCSFFANSESGNSPNNTVENMAARKSSCGESLDSLRFQSWQQAVFKGFAHGESGVSFTVDAPLASLDPLLL